MKLKIQFDHGALITLEGVKNFKVEAGSESLLGMEPVNNSENVGIEDEMDVPDFIQKKIND